MSIAIKKYTLSQLYVSILDVVTVNLDLGFVYGRKEEEIPYPLNDGSIMDAVVRVYLHHPTFKTPQEVAHLLHLDKRELSGAIHILTGVTHEELMRQYRLRGILELLTKTRLPVSAIATYYGYSTIHALNRFLTDQTELTANEIRSGKNSQEKRKRLAWWQR